MPNATDQALAVWVDYKDQALADLWHFLAVDEQGIEDRALELLESASTRVTMERERLERESVHEINRRCRSLLADALLLFVLRAEREGRR